ncbi:MAG: UPF0149 family protein [Mariprofundales bacterium]|nr:UPF0149 family protein [Mariprofundales bacterium]
MLWNEDQILAELSFPSGDDLPEEALLAALNHYDQLKETLHHALRMTPKAILDIENEHCEEYMLQFFAIYLAAAMHDEAAFPPIRDLFINHGEEAYTVTGGMMMLHLSQILASVCPHPAPLMEASLAPGLYALARGPFCSAMAVLYLQNSLSRAKLIDWFTHCLGNSELAPEMLNDIVITSVHLALFEMEDPIFSLAEDDDLIDIFDGLDDLRKLLRQKIILPRLPGNYALISKKNLISTLKLLHFFDNGSQEEDDPPLFDDEETEILEQFLHQLRSESHDNSITLSWVHGLLFGIVITPEIIMPDEWLPQIIGRGESPWASTEEASTVVNLLIETYNRLLSDYHDNMLYCPFHHSGFNDPSAEKDATLWARGLMAAISLRWDFWTLNLTITDEPYSDAFFSLMMLTHEDYLNNIVKQAQEKSISKEKLQQISLTTLAPSVDSLIAFSRRRSDGGEMSPPPTTSNKVGRNASCPCGSGKKFKRCCGAPGRVVH